MEENKITDEQFNNLMEMLAQPTRRPSLAQRAGNFVSYAVAALVVGIPLVFLLTWMCWAIAWAWTHFPGL